MKYSNKITKTKNKKQFFIFIAFILLGFSFFIGYTYYYSNKNNQNSDGTNYPPPTSEEQKAGDEKKQEIVQKQEQDNSQKKDNPDQAFSQRPISSSNATVVITDVGQYDNVIEVRAFISDRYQDGTCKITLTKNGLTVSKTTEAYKDATTTICTNPLFKRSEFSQAGDWQVVVEYNSQIYSGKSSIQTVKIK